jgi:hypothetical protein
MYVAPSQYNIFRLFLLANTNRIKKGKLMSIFQFNVCTLYTYIYTVVCNCFPDPQESQLSLSTSYKLFKFETDCVMNPKLFVVRPPLSFKIKLTRHEGHEFGSKNVIQATSHENQVQSMITFFLRLR